MKTKKHIHPVPALKKDVSVHRAFVYGAGLPGLGQYYAGARMRAIATALAFFTFSAWFAWLLVEIMGGLASRIFSSLNGMVPPALVQVPLIPLAISFFGMYFSWLWAMIDAVAAAAAYRRKAGAPSQSSAFWATATAWFCPGAGQVYTDERRFGYLLFAAYFMAILLTVPAYVHLVQHVVEMVQGGQLSSDRPLGVIDLIHGLMIRTNYSFGRLLQASLRCFSVAAAIDILARGVLKKTSRWSEPSAAATAGLAGLNWLCPGAGQLLQARRKPGWIILAGYIGSRLLIGLLLSADLISVAQADSLAWIPVILQWGSVAEAVLCMMTNRRRQSSS